MPLLNIIIIAIIQGVTEFLPISSSGHLVLAENIMNPDAIQSWDNHMLLNVAVHVGTLLSVLLYFRKDIGLMLIGLKSALTGQINNEGTKLILYISIGSIPVIIAGLALSIMQPSWLLITEIVGWSTLIFGIILWLADNHDVSDKTLNDITIKDAILIGLAQMLALIPGVSRSGITMTAGRFLGYSRTECAHYALLLGIIAISGAGTIGALTLLDAGNLTITKDIILAIIISFVTGWLAIAAMMQWLTKASFKVFAIYRIGLGIVLLAFVYHGAAQAVLS